MVTAEMRERRIAIWFGPIHGRPNLSWCSCCLNAGAQNRRPWHVNAVHGSFTASTHLLNCSIDGPAE
jgi:hypothetical protein